MDDQKVEGISPPSSPLQADPLNRSGHSTFNSCKDRLDNVFSAAAYSGGLSGFLKLNIWGLGGGEAQV